jgi:transcription antitermination factor NusG
VALHLAKREVELFLPQYKAKRQWRDRRVELQMPLFPGYLFVRIPREQRLCVLQAPGVISLVGASGRPEALEDAEIERWKAVMSEGNDPRPHALIRIGERVVVTRGALEGREGFLVREKNKNRVVLTLDLIQRSMSVEVDADVIAPAMIGQKASAMSAGGCRA